MSYGAAPTPEDPTQSNFYNNLLDSINQYGIIEPLLVINLPDGFHVKVGNSRLWAAKELGIDEIDCILVTLERDIGKVMIPEGEVVDIRREFKYPIIWTERENYIGMKCTHFHMGEGDVK